MFLKYIDTQKYRKWRHDNLIDMNKWCFYDFVNNNDKNWFDTINNPLLDGCMLLDNVRNRSLLVFIQYIGRVLRKDKNNNKQFGLIIDSYIKDDNTDNKAIIHKIIDYYEKLNNQSTYYENQEHKAQQFYEFKNILNINITNQNIVLKINGIDVTIQCNDMTWEKPEIELRNEVNNIIRHDIGIEVPHLLLEQKILEQKEYI